MKMEHAISLAIDQIYYAIANSSILRENKTMLLIFFLMQGLGTLPPILWHYLAFFV